MVTLIFQFLSRFSMNVFRKVFKIVTVLKEQLLLFLMIFCYYFRKHYSKYEKTRRTPKTNDTSCEKHWKHRIGKQIF